MRRRHLPMRVCLGCGAVDQQAAMLRIVRTPDGRLALDAARRAGGRGGYLHRQSACWVEFARRKGLVRSLRAPADRAVRSALVTELECRAEGKA